MSDESLRRSIRAIGMFWYFKALLGLLGGVGAWVIMATWGAPSNFTAKHYLGVLPVLALSAGFFKLGRGLRQFRPWARIITIVMCWVAVIGVPVGTIIGAAFLYVLFKGRHLFYGAMPAGVPMKTLET